MTPEYHRCRGGGIGTLPAPQPEPQSIPGSEVSLDRAKKICEKLADNLLHHSETCEGCKMLGRPCFNKLNIEALHGKWQEKVRSMI